ncbi:helix-turn-helix transcriptional regulator [Amycolatopsis mediterranei]|uniref:helix-turn-helix transcriptional regulator n=1 Tax=Amycolatopsis mediterranei TaxID=33910 RepID=UPI00341842EB
MSVGRRRDGLISARKVAGFTQEGLADVLRVDRSTVARWEAGDYVPLPYLWPKLARVLGRSRDELQALIGPSTVTREFNPDDSFEPVFAWLDRHAGWPLGRAREQVRASADALPRNRPNLLRSVIADALADYYPPPTSDHRAYTARCGRVEVTTSVLTRPAWLDLACLLTAAGEQTAFEGGGARPPVAVDERAAVQRPASGLPTCPCTGCSTSTRSLVPCGRGLGLRRLSSTRLASTCWNVS